MSKPLESHLIGQADRSRASFWHEVRALTVLDRLDRGRSAKVADLGAGAGLLGHKLARERPEVRYSFFEPLDSLASHLDAAFGTDARLDSITDVSGADVVALLDVVEHVEDDRAFLSEIIATMDPGSLLVVTVPALPILWSSWDEDLGHFRRYTRASMARLATALPIDVLEISYLFPELVPPGLVRKSLRALSKSSKASTSDFPEFPPPVDRAMRALSTGTYRLRRLWPFGSSLVFVGATRRR